MKIIKILKYATFAIFALFTLVSCDKEEGSTTFYGKILLSPSNVKNGEQVTLKIGSFDFSTSADTGDAGVSVSGNIGTSVVINGKNVVKSVSYYIDGRKVAESSNKDNGYNAIYVVNNLSVGTHEITAHCSSNFKHYTIEESITAATLQVQK